VVPMSSLGGAQRLRGRVSECATLSLNPWMGDFVWSLTWLP